MNESTEALPVTDQSILDQVGAYIDEAGGLPDKNPFVFKIDSGEIYLSNLDEEKELNFFISYDREDISKILLTAESVSVFCLLHHDSEFEIKTKDHVGDDVYLNSDMVCDSNICDNNSNSFIEDALYDEINEATNLRVYSQVYQKNATFSYVYDSDNFDYENGNLRPPEMNRYVYYDRLLEFCIKNDRSLLKDLSEEYIFSQLLSRDIPEINQCIFDYFIKSQIIYMIHDAIDELTASRINNPKKSYPGLFKDHFYNTKGLIDTLIQADNIYKSENFKNAHLKLLELIDHEKSYFLGVNSINGTVELVNNLVENYELSDGEYDFIFYQMAKSPSISNYYFFSIENNEQSQKNFFKILKKSSLSNFTNKNIDIPPVIKKILLQENQFNVDDINLNNDISL